MGPSPLVAVDVNTPLQRHKFTKAFALESLRSILIWRLSHLQSQDPSAFPPSPLYVLPPPATDILRRPILILRLADLANLQKDPREHILHNVESLRINLHNINASSPPESPLPGPVLQYILLVDMENASMRNFVRFARVPAFISEYFPPWLTTFEDRILIC